MNTETINPENLYSLYRKTRPKTTQSMLSSNGASIESLRSDSDSLPAQVYHVYRETRNHDHEASVDAIMSYIHAEQSALNPASPSELNNRSEGSQRSLSEDARREKNSSITSALSKSLDHLSNFFKSGFALPAMAAALLAVVLIPFLSSQHQSATDIPHAMFDHAAVVVNLIEQSPAQSLGFSNALSVEKNAFGQGVLSTDLSLAVIAQDQVAIESYRRQISLIVPEWDTTSLDENLLLNGELVPSGEARDVVDNAPIPSELLDRINSFQSELLQDMSAGEKAWFKLGSAIEAIYASAKLQQETGFTEALTEALDRYSSMPVPEPVLPASKLLRQLQQMSADESSQNHDLSAILNLSRDIKVLML